jgi:hypothetical protein
MEFDELTQDEQVRGINHVAKHAVKFSELDNCANLARDIDPTWQVWKACVDTIHSRNMVMLGKTRQGFPLAVWKKGFHEVVVENEHTIIKGKAVHVRQLCQRGYKFIPVRRLDNE